MLFHVMAEIKATECSNRKVQYFQFSALSSKDCERKDFLV